MGYVLNPIGSAPIVGEQPRCFDLVMRIDPPKLDPLGVHESSPFICWLVRICEIFQGLLAAYPLGLQRIFGRAPRPVSRRGTLA